MGSTNCVGDIRVTIQQLVEVWEEYLETKGNRFVERKKFGRSHPLGLIPTREPRFDNLLDPARERLIQAKYKQYTVLAALLLFESLVLNKLRFVFPTLFLSATFLGLLQTTSASLTRHHEVP